jgi:hypothetical protein
VFLPSARINDPWVDAGVSVPAATRHLAVVASGQPWLSEPASGRRTRGAVVWYPFVLTYGGQLNISGPGRFDAVHPLETRPNVLLQPSGVFRQDFIEGMVRRLGRIACCSPAGAAVAPCDDVLACSGGAYGRRREVGTPGRLGSEGLRPLRQARSPLVDAMRHATLDSGATSRPSAPSMSTICSELLYLSSQDG